MAGRKVPFTLTGNVVRLVAQEHMAAAAVSALRAKFNRRFPAACVDASELVLANAELREANARLRQIEKAIKRADKNKDGKQ